MERPDTLPKSSDKMQPPAAYGGALREIGELVEQARRLAARSVNSLMTATYWSVGRRIVECEQEGEIRAAYGARLVSRLSEDLTRRFGRGFSARNLAQMRRFYLQWPILQTPSAKLAGGQDGGEILQTPSALSAADVTALAQRLPLPWSHYVRLLAIEDSDVRRFYEEETLRGGWTVRQLARQIDSQFYQRTLLSRDKAALLANGRLARPSDRVTPEEEIKDPYVLEFLGLKDEYSESDLEEALVRQLEAFLLELGSDFAFIGRQRRLRIGDEWYRVDLLFYNRRLRCLVVIDLKLGRFTHADAGQMHLYLNYAREHWTHPHENPPVGLILCAHKDAAVAHYALDGLPNKVLAAEYRLALPDEATLTAELERTRRMLEVRRTDS